jgi:hypothetical protein
MQGPDSHDDELSRRRESRRQTALTEQEEKAALEEEELPRLGWRDTVAMIVAAYQVLFPIVLAMFATLGLAYLLFRWYFH